jgi:hypothetical protein
MIDPILNWLNGISAFMVVVGAWLYAILNMRRYLKGKVISTLYMAILSIALAFGWTGITLSFFSVLFFGSTLPEVAAIISYFSYSMIPIGSCAVILISWDLLFTPKYKKVGLAIFGAFYAIYYIFLFLTWSPTVMVSDVSGQIFDDWLSPTSVSFWMIWVIVGASSVLWAIGFNSFRKKSAGEFRRRAIYLFLATFFIGGGILLDTVAFIGALGEFAWIARLMMIPGVYTGYVGLNPI